MAKLRLVGILICLGAVSIGAVTLRASGSDDSAVISFKGPVNWALATKPSAAIRAVDPNPGKLATIFSNWKQDQVGCFNACATL